jgi:hypothetical protein
VIAAMPAIAVSPSISRRVKREFGSMVSAIGDELATLAVISGRFFFIMII